MKRRITGVVAVLLIASTMLWASDVAELRTAFSEAVSSGDVEAAIENYDDMVSEAENAYSKAARSYEKAVEAGNRRKAMEARDEMRSARYSAMTEEETDNLLSLILAEDGPERAEHAQWLMTNSRYYNPSITYEWNASGDNYSFRYSSSKTVTPGEEIVLPDKNNVRVNSSASGVLSGWGVTPDSVTYMPGETIVAPYTSQTLYAIWATEVVFRDDVTGLENRVTDVQDGDVIDVPAVSCDDSSFVFSGWVDRSTGEYIAPDETTVELEGNGAVFEALWKNAELSDPEARHYSIESVPVNTQAELTFSIANNGTENLRNLKVECTGDDGLSVLKGNGIIREVKAGESVAVQGLKIVGTATGEHMIHVSLTDRDGDIWEADFSVNIV